MKTLQTPKSPMTRVSPSEQRRLSRARFPVFFTLLLAAICMAFIFATHTYTYSLLIQAVPAITLTSFHPSVLCNQTIITTLGANSTSISKEVHESVSQNEPKQLIEKERKEWFNEEAPQLDVLNSTTLTRRFQKRAQDFFEDACKVRIFMTFISFSLRFFGDREFLALDSVFKSNPNSCLLILSNTMDSVEGFRILKRLTDRGFRVRAITPDLDFLFNNTPAQSWLDHIKRGESDPGKIPLAQNLSNLIRLVILYKYGGVYMDTDFIILKDLSSLHNSIAAQSTTASGNWNTLNNAVLIFDKNHSLLYEFIKEFASTFNGNIWGHNGPDLVSRVVQRESKTTQNLNLTVLPRMAFYPVYWTDIKGFFISPGNQDSKKIEDMVSELRRSSYGVHLWNKISSGLEIKDGSIMATLIAEQCVICNIK